jgi:hypothetical protein
VQHRTSARADVARWGVRLSVSRKQRVSRRTHCSARQARSALVALQARGAPHRQGCYGGTPAGPPRGTQSPLQCRPQNGRGTGVGTQRRRAASPHRARRQSRSVSRISSRASQGARHGNARGEHRTDIWWRKRYLQRWGGLAARAASHAPRQPAAQSSGGWLRVRGSLRRKAAGRLERGTRHPSPCARRLLRARRAPLAAHVAAHAASRAPWQPAAQSSGGLRVRGSLRRKAAGRLERATRHSARRARRGASWARGRGEAFKRPRAACHSSSSRARALTGPKIPHADAWLPPDSRVGSTPAGRMQNAQRAGESEAFEAAGAAQRCSIWRARALTGTEILDANEQPAPGSPVGSAPLGRTQNRQGIRPRARRAVQGEGECSAIFVPY